jgi:hypothetical protein
LHAEKFSFPFNILGQNNEVNLKETQGRAPRSSACPSRLLNAAAQGTRYAANDDASCPTRGVLRWS